MREEIVTERDHKKLAHTHQQRKMVSSLEAGERERERERESSSITISTVAGILKKTNRADRGSDYRAKKGTAVCICCC